MRPWAVVLVGLCLEACAYRVVPRRVEPAPSPPPVSAAPLGLTPISLALEAPLEGRTVNLDEYRGRGVLIAAISVEDLHSQALVRHMERLGRAHPDDLAVVAVVGDQSDPASLRTLLDAYRSVLGLERVVLTVASPAVRAGATGLGSIDRVPMVFLLNRVGAVTQRLVGYQPYTTLAALVAPTLPRSGRPVAADP